MAACYKLIIVDKWGHALERDGSFYSNDSSHPHFEKHFEDLESARRFAEIVVLEHPHVECDVIHNDQIVFQHFDTKWRSLNEEQEARMFAKHRRRDRVILSALIIGVTFLVLGVLFACFQ